MLLANMAKSDSMIARLQSLRRRQQQAAVVVAPGAAAAAAPLTSSEMALDQLIELFNKGANGGYNPAADYDYLGYVFADMVKVRIQVANFATYLPLEEGYGQADFLTDVTLYI